MQNKHIIWKIFYQKSKIFVNLMNFNQLMSYREIIKKSEKKKDKQIIVKLNSNHINTILTKKGHNN